jgi:hypothetical protein
MTVARPKGELILPLARPAWGQRVESHLDLPAGSFTNLRGASSTVTTVEA